MHDIEEEKEMNGVVEQTPESDVVADHWWHELRVVMESAAAGHPPASRRAGRPWAPEERAWPLLELSLHFVFVMVAMPWTYYVSPRASELTHLLIWPLWTTLLFAVWPVYSSEHRGLAFWTVGNDSAFWSVGKRV